MSINPQTAIATLLIEACAILAKTWGGHDVRSQHEEGPEGGDAGELVPGRELKLAQIVLTDDAFDALVGELATRSFFNTPADSPRARAFSTFRKLPLESKYKNCVAVITFGVGANVVRIEPAQFKNLRLTFTEAGAAELSLTIVGARPRTLEVLDLEAFGGKVIDVQLAFGPLDIGGEEQQQLPLTQASAAAEGDDDDEDEGDDPEAQALRDADEQRQYDEAAAGLERQQAVA